MNSVFCTAIKGNERKCRNFARKKCPENFCYSHRKLVENFTEPEKNIKKIILGDENTCYFTDCNWRSFNKILYKNKTKYSCWKHTG